MGVASREATALFPLQSMLERVESARRASGAELFDELMLLGELAIKLSVAGLVAAIESDPERNHYRQTHRLVRATGIGEWADTLDEILTGPPSQFLTEEARAEQKQFTARVASGDWQHSVVSLVNGCVREVAPQVDPVPKRTSCRQWPKEFAVLRNKTKGHGAVTTRTKTRLAGPLEEALQTFISNFELLGRQWAYLHRNLSGKYRVAYLNPRVSKVRFEPLKREDTFQYEDGLYVDFGLLVPVELAKTDIELTDFFLANGSFNGRSCEYLSYATGATRAVDASPFIDTPSDLPGSHTGGALQLDILDGARAFTNLPPAPTGYVERPQLEQQTKAALANDVATTVTLVGPGGIGKTSLALRSLHNLQFSDRFEAIVWFSARDVDLLADGPRRVRADVLDRSDMARMLVDLFNPREMNGDDFDPVGYLSQALNESPIGGPILFVLDNFETVRNPVDLFQWVYAQTRLPNKVLITTRHREFNGDFGIDVGGMSFEEAKQLIDHTASSLGITGMVTESYARELFHESDGHPYVIKILMGEAAKAGTVGRVQRIMAGSDQLLTALFERTYNGLSNVAKRIILTLCDWRSAVPEIALEAVLMRSSSTRIDVQRAVEELERSSFIEVTKSEKDDTRFISVPLTTRVFGERKLAVSPLKEAISADKQLLLAFGAIQENDIKYGFKPRVDRLLSHIAKQVEKRPEKLVDYREMIEFIGRSYNPAWLAIATLYEESGRDDSAEMAKQALTQFLEHSAPYEEQRATWKRLAALCRRTNDTEGELHALVEMAAVPDTWFAVISDAAHRFNTILSVERPRSDLATASLLARRLASIMLDRISEAGSADCSRLAWIWLHLGEKDNAIRETRRGLTLDSDDHYCRRLADKLGIGM